MKVLLISHTCQSMTEGQPKAAGIALRLEGELTVLTPGRWKHYGKWREAEPPQSATYRYIPGKTFFPWLGPAQFYLHCYPGLASLLKDFRPDVIDIWEEPWSLVSAQVCWLRNRIVPNACIISETEQNLHRHYPPPFRWFRNYTLSQADFAIGRSNEAVQVIRSQGYKGPAEVVPNAVDPNLFFPMDKNTFRRKLNLSGFVVGYVGRIVRQKGLLDLVNALPLCPKSTQLLFVGSGEDTNLLKARLAELGLSSRAQFLPECAPGELPALMNAMDILALPSQTTATWKEQFGRVIIEAHACGTPVIGSTSGAIPEVIGKGGVVFPERNPEALAKVIAELANSPECLFNMGCNGLRQVMDRYTWDCVSEQMVGIYHRVRRRQ